MLKMGFILVSTTVILSASWIPTFSFGENDSRNIDENFVRDDKKEVVRDIENSKMYYDSTPSTKMNFYAAWDYCQKVDHLGHKDWRVPTKNEFKSILNLGRRDITVKYAFKNVQKDIYWSSTEDRYESAWYFDVDLGRYSTGDYRRNHYVMCVRDIK